MIVIRLVIIAGVVLFLFNDANVLTILSAEDSESTVGSSGSERKIPKYDDCN